LKNLIYYYPKNTYKMYISQNKKKEMDKMSEKIEKENVQRNHKNR